MLVPRHHRLGGGHTTDLIFRQPGKKNSWATSQRTVGLKSAKLTQPSFLQPATFPALPQLLPFAQSVRISTTTDLRYDWCSINGVHITGVVVVIRGKWQLVGEVKGDDSHGMTQLVAAMHAVAERTGEWPCGELVLYRRYMLCHSMYICHCFLM